MGTEQTEANASFSDESAGRNGRYPEQEDEFSLLGLLAILAKHKWMIICAVIAGAIIALIIAIQIPNRYTATTTLLSPQQPMSLSSALVSQLGGIGAFGAVASRELGLKNPSDIYVGMLKSRVIADALIKQFHLMDVYRDKKMADAREDLEKASDIQAGKDGIISISIEDKDPQRAAALANSYVVEIKKLAATLAVTEAAQRRLFFEQQLQKTKEDLAHSEVALKQTQQKTGVIQLNGQATAIIESVARIQGQIAGAEVQLQTMQSYATEKNPNLVRLRQELAGLNDQLAKLEKKRNAGEGDIRVPTAAVPEVGLEYARRLRDVKYYETIFEILAQQFEGAKLDEAREGTVIQVIDPAILPDKKSFPPRGLIIIGTTLIAFFGAVLWAFLAESLSRRQVDPVVQQQLAEIRKLFFWKVASK